MQMADGRWAVTGKLLGPWTALVGGVQFAIGVWAFLAARANLTEADWRHPDFYLPDWSWLAWMCLGLASVLILVLINAANLILAKNGEIEALRNVDDRPFFR